jgi:hypothetical protein
MMAIASLSCVPVVGKQRSFYERLNSLIVASFYGVRLRRQSSRVREVGVCGHTLLFCGDEQGLYHGSDVLCSVSVVLCIILSHARSRCTKITGSQVGRRIAVARITRTEPTDILYRCDIVCATQIGNSGSVYRTTGKWCVFGNDRPKRHFMAGYGERPVFACRTPCLPNLCITPAIDDQRSV